MILRRIIKNVAARDWFTVTIEFVIVVVGIFVGLEVSNWNEERKFAAQEKAYLAQLRDEIVQNNRLVEFQTRFIADVLDSSQRSLDFLNGDGRCDRDCAGILIDLFHASQIWGTAYRSATFDEVERLGFPSDRGVRELVRDYYQWLDGWDAVNAFRPEYRESVRGHFPPQASRLLWRDCYELLDGQHERLIRDCAGALASLDTGAILQDVHADVRLEPQLHFWIGQNIVAESMYSSMLADGEDAISTISAWLDDEP